MIVMILFLWMMKRMLFSFLPKNVHFILKNAILCLFFKNVSSSKRVVVSFHTSVVELIVLSRLRTTLNG